MAMATACGVVDDKGEEIFADKIGLLLARDLSKLHPGATFVVDVKSTGLYKTDPVLKENGVTVDYFKTGHSYIKRRTTELDALAGFEKSGHMFFRKPYGYGYDDALVAAAAVLQMLDRNPGRSLSDLKAELGDAWTSLTMSPHCDDEKKYGIVDQVVADYQALAPVGRRNPRPQDHRREHRQRRPRDAGGWLVGSCPRLVQQAGTGRRGRVDAGRGRHARPFPQRSETAPRQVPGSRQLQPGNLIRAAGTVLRLVFIRQIQPSRRRVDRPPPRTRQKLPSESSCLTAR